MIAKPLRLIGWALTATVIAILVAALFLVGSPLEARKLKADDQRESDLFSLADSVRTYYAEQKKLPEKLSDCKSYNGENALPTDPETGKQYEYRQVGKDRFEVCAIFEADTMKKRARYYRYELDMDHHPSGRACFTFPAKKPG